MKMGCHIKRLRPLNHQPKSHNYEGISRSHGLETTKNTHTHTPQNGHFWAQNRLFGLFPVGIPPKMCMSILEVSRPWDHEIPS